MPGSTKSTVLIVDDTPTNLQVMAHLLVRAGYHVLVAEDGSTALELAASAGPDLILLDVMMPGMDGFETCLRLRTAEATRTTPILFTTARSETRDKVRGFQAGAVDYITKPFQEEEVLARVETHLTLARQKRELEALLAERGRFMRIAAHDLRNPLSVILGWAGVGHGEAESDSLRETFRRIEGAAQRMGSIIEDFLALQVIHGAAGRGTIAPFDLPQLVAQVLEQQEFAARNKNITLRLAAPAADRPALANVAHTHQVLTNYVSNAVKYSPPATEVALVAAVTDGHWRVEVRDQGPGIDEDERDRLFVEFARISNKPTGGETSTGLGLAIVKRLAEAQGGRVGAEFPPTGGSVFWLELPVSPAPPVPAT